MVHLARRHCKSTCDVHLVCAASRIRQRVSRIYVIIIDAPFEPCLGRQSIGIRAAVQNRSCAVSQGGCAVCYDWLLKNKSLIPSAGCSRNIAGTHLIMVDLIRHKSKNNLIADRLPCGADDGIQVRQMSITGVCAPLNPCACRQPIGIHHPHQRRAFLVDKFGWQIYNRGNGVGNDDGYCGRSRVDHPVICDELKGCSRNAK